MNILLFETNSNTINDIQNVLKKISHNTILVKEIEQVRIMLKGLNSIDLVITNLELDNFSSIDYLKTIRNINPYLPLVVVSSSDFQLSIKEIVNLKIEAFVDPKNLSKELDSILNDIDSKIQNYKLNKLFENFSMYSATDIDGNITVLSESFCELLGYKKEELIGQNHSIIKHPNNDYYKYQKLWNSITKGINWCGELPVEDKTGNIIWCNTIIFPKYNTTGKIIGYGAIRHDITSQKILEENNTIDALTGLYNQRFYQNIFPMEIKRAKRLKEDLVFMIIDIDDFKSYNSYYGYSNGDEVLKILSKQLKEYFKRSNDFIFRLDRSEFVVITNATKLEKTILYAEKIRKKIYSKKIAHQNSKNKILSVSIGVCVVKHNDNFDGQQIYNFADYALRNAKKCSGNILIVYNNDIKYNQNNCNSHLVNQSLDKR